MKISIAAFLCLTAAIAKLAGPLETHPRLSMIAWGTILLASIYLFVQGLLGQPEEDVREAPGPLPERPELVNAEIVSFLGLLQRKGRFIDFLMDDITRYDDKQVGAAARIVHQGCSQIIREHFDIAPVRGDAEGSRITLDGNYNAVQNRLVGRVVGKPPFKGVVLHRGWKTGKVTLPRISGDGELMRELIAPAEIELT